MDQVYGYRKVSLANVLKHNSDSPKWAQSLIRNTLGLFFKDPTLIRAISKGEKALHEVVGLTKDMIVVRGLVVMIDNMISNSVQLVLENDNMSIFKAVAYQLEGLKAAKKYQENQSRIRRLKYDIAIAEDPTKLNHELVKLREEQANNPASTLVDAGLLTAIVEDVEEDNNPFSYANALGEKFNSVNKHMPESVQWVTGNLVASKKSEFHKTAYQFTQIGDFGSRYAMYKHLKEQGKLTDGSLDTIMDSFVNYDHPSNRYIQYLGDMGLVWFIKYFMRIQMVIIKNTIKAPRKVAELFALSNITGVDILVTSKHSSYSIQLRIS